MLDPCTVHLALTEAERRLAPLHDGARLDAELLLAFALDRPRSHIHAHPEQALTPPQRARFDDLIQRRAAGWPVAYLTGRREFWSLDLEVTPDTLIPRPETELLVERTLRHLPPDSEARVADLGTGSGALALAIARERPRARVVASDVSEPALAVARANAARLGINNVAFRAGDWCAALGGERFDVIASNPPYVPRGDPHLTRGDLRFEPLIALAAGPDGLDALRRIAFHARRHLIPDGWLLLEHGYNQETGVRQLLMRYGYRDVTDHRDAAGHGRVCEARRPPEF
ncbi:MAG: peptide chain release factor N(5)-glutamine methyltransferase [Gammaproteobacteria bacterium]|nr:peptide chain release factor N(5)-glutamine methyltransferase [Gammaproteobacteria bacterium]